MKQWTIGSRAGRKADLYVDDTTVSRLHASLMRTDDGRWLVEDRGSTNGTARFLDGKWMRIQQAYVQLDDRLRFGRAETTVRRLVESRVRDAPPPHEVIPWRRDLAIAFTELRSIGNLKTSIVLAFDIILSPARVIMQCAILRRPINPLSFMVFAAIISVCVNTFGVTASTIISSTFKDECRNELAKQILLGFPLVVFYLSAQMSLTLLYNAFAFRVYRYFADKRRPFDDFMRLTAVVNGISWILSAIVLLYMNEFVNEFVGIQHKNPTCGIESGLDPEARNLIKRLVLVSVFVNTLYIFYLNVLAQKKFWRISYLRSFFCYFASIGLAAFMISCISGVILFFIGVLTMPLP